MTKTKAPLKDYKTVVGDAFRIFGVTRKDNLDETKLADGYSKVTFGFRSISEMMNLMKAMGAKPQNYEIFIPKTEGVMVAVSQDDDQVFVLAPRLDALERIKK